VTGNSSSRIVRFSIFDVNLHTGELRKAGQKVKLQEQPLQVLTALLERPGDWLREKNCAPNSGRRIPLSTSITVSTLPSRDYATRWANRRKRPSSLRPSHEKDIAS